MKKLILILLTSFLIFSLSAELVDRIVAKVGSDIILLSDVYKMMYQMQLAGIPKEQISMDMEKLISFATLNKEKERKKPLL